MDISPHRNHVPRGRNFLTRTTTRTFPPGDGLAEPSWRAIWTGIPSRARREGLDAVDLSVAAEAEVDRILGEVMPVVADNSEEETDEIEPGPAWSI